MNKVFRNVGAVRPGRSVFNLSYEKKLSCDMGQLIPVMCDEVVPGDIMHIGNQAVVRFQPLVSPVLHEIKMYVHYYFVPYRILWDDWESFITGGPDGDDASVLPRWTPTLHSVGSLWDMLGFPDVVPTGALPLTFPRDAYNKIYNDFYRDENSIDEVDLDQEAILNRSWAKDYFTSALPWQQRGTAPALPISGTAPYSFTTSAVWPAVSAGVTHPAMQYDILNNHPYDAGTKAALEDNVVAGSGTIDIGSATPLSIADMRLAFQIQKWMERNARGGARYTEFLKSHFGVSPRDDRLQRPEYIGGSQSPVIISEVLQTSETNTTPQGTMAGHGIAVSDAYVAKYRVQEYGLIMGIMSIMPTADYWQGINKQWLRNTRYDFYFPEFANLSEQAIIRAEIFANGVSVDNNTLFGYQGRYDEMRVKQNMICGVFRTTYKYWHLAREFASYPELNQSFLDCVPKKDIFAASTEPGLLVQFGNIIKAVRPMPAIANPGWLDHF